MNSSGESVRGWMLSLVEGSGVAFIILLQPLHTQLVLT